MGIGDWGLGIWGLGIGPNPQSPIPNPQSPHPHLKSLYLFYITIKKYLPNKFNFKIIKNK